MPRSQLPPCVLTIAGSDSAAAAGIQADLKTYSAYGVHGLTAIAAVTAQNTHSTSAIQVLPPRILLAQLEALRSDFRIAAVKIGMLGSAANIRLTAQWLGEHRMPNVVLDPVLVASSGRHLLPANALSILRRHLLPLAQVLTPNLPEAAALLSRPIHTHNEMQSAASELRALGADAVLIKGGHLDARGVRDYFVDNHGAVEYAHQRRNYNVRGTGCSLSSAIAAGLALGLSTRAAVERAERYLQNAFRNARRVGRGPSRILQHNAPHGD